MTLFLVGLNSFPARERQSARLLSFKGGVSAVRSISHRLAGGSNSSARDRRRRTRPTSSEVAAVAGVM